MKKITIYVLLAIAFSAQSQNFQWLDLPTADFNLNPQGLGYPIAIDPSGNVFMSGFKDTPYLYDNVFGNVFVNKYATDGSLLLSKTFTGRVIIYDMVADNSGNILISAGWLQNFSFGDLTLATVNQDIQPLLMKLDNQGNLLWHFKPPGEDGLEAFSEAVATDISGNAYIGYVAASNSYIVKLSALGEILSTITQANTRNITSVSVDNAGNIYASGSCSDVNSHYAGVNVAPQTGYNTYVVKYSPTGIYQWVKYVEDVTCPRPQVAARTPDAVYFSSYLYGAFAFGDIQAEGPNENGPFQDFFITKLNADGNFQWMRETPGSGNVTPGNRNFLNADAQNNVYFGGRINGTTDWGNGINTSVDGYSNEDAAILKYDTNGTLQFIKTAGGDSDDHVDAIGVDANGNIFLSGIAAANSTFGNFSHTAGDFQSYPFLTKINGNLLATPQTDNPKAVLYPNPAGNAFYISNINQAVKGILTNMLGQKIMDLEIENGIPTDINQLAKGAYLVKLQGFNAIKLLKQ